MKLWSHVDSYYFGIFAAFLFEKMKEIKQQQIEKEVKEKKWFDNLILNLVDGSISQFQLMSSSIILIICAIYCHLFVDNKDYFAGLNPFGIPMVNNEKWF